MDTNNTTTEQNTSQAQQPSILDAALAYAARGWAVTPLIGKGAFLDEWNTLPFSDEAFIRQEFARPGVSGIGLRTGVVSGGLIDVDLDSVEAERIAPAVLAKTNAIFGRRAKPRSHYLYRLPVGQSLRGMKFCDPLREEGDGKVLLELRGELLQSMAPVSLHPSGERVEWATEGDPAEVDVDDQLQQAHTLAAAALLARYWPYNNRQDAALALCGGLLRAGWEPEDVRDFLGIVAVGADDDELEKRLTAVDYTDAKVRAEMHATGWPRLAALTHADVVQAVRKWLVVTRQDSRPTVLVTSGDLHRTGDEIVTLLQAANDPPHLFTGPTGKPARLTLDGDGRPAMEVLDRHAMKDAISRAVCCLTPGTDKKPDPKPINPPDEVVHNVLAGARRPAFPPLLRIVTHPVFGARRFDALRTTSGYAADARVYLHLPPGLRIPDVPERPTQSQIEDACALLEELLPDFPFVGDADKAHAVALALLPFGRPLIAGPTPLHLIPKPVQGTGGTLLAKVLTGIAAGPGGAEMMSQPGSEDEMRKLITAKLLAGANIFALDNLTRTLDSGALAAAITAGRYEDRVLRKSQMVAGDVTWTWLATGNNPDIGGDIVRRVVPINLDAKQERPWQRDPQAFKHPNLEAWANDNRGALIGAALTLWSAWMAGDCPQWDGQPLGGFEDWSRTLGGVLQVAGIPGFLGNLSDLYETANPEDQRWRALTEAWLERYGTTEVTSGEVYEVGVQLRLWRGESLQGRDALSQFGWALRKQRSRRYGPLTILQAGKGRSGNLYRLAHADGQERPRQSSGTVRIIHRPALNAEQVVGEVG